MEDLVLIKFDKNYTNSRPKYKSSVIQFEFILFYPHYSYDIISVEKILNGSCSEVELSLYNIENM